MKIMEKKTTKYLLCALCIILFSVAGYFYISFSPLEEKKEDTWADSGFLKLGRNLTIRNTDNRLAFSDSKDILSANGLYYATWTLGDSRPYENSDGDTVPLYDAQLYLVLGEHKNEVEAQKDCTKWLDAANDNYEVLAEEEVTCNGQAYHLIHYNCVREGNPYARGVSAFGVHGKISVCAELTCLEGFDEDLRGILTGFLDGCTYEEK